MTKTLTLILSLCLTLLAFGQNFEGQIIYHNTYKSKVLNISDQQWTAMLGSTQHYFIKGGDYRSNANGTMVLWQIYINSENRLYNKFGNSTTITWNDGAINQDEVLKTELKRNADEVLGYNCDELTLTCKSGVQKYYFSPALAVESSLFERHQFGNWWAYISKAKALPLKIVIETGQFIMETVATEVKPMVLDRELFTLPADAKTVKSSY